LGGRVDRRSLAVAALSKYMQGGGKVKDRWYKNTSRLKFAKKQNTHGKEYLEKIETIWSDAES
jgi:hypothetical protein